MAVSPRLGALLPAVLLSLAAPVAAGGVYKWTDEHGGVHFSDTPPGAGAGEVEERDGGSVSSVENPGYNLDRARMEVPFTPANGNMIVQGRVNGVPLRFIVDTGASLVVVPEEVARRAGLELRGGTVRLNTANGTVEARPTRVGRLEVARLSQRDVRAVVHTFADESTGLLGMSFLGAYRMTVDQDRRVLVLEAR